MLEVLQLIAHGTSLLYVWDRDLSSTNKIMLMHRRVCDNRKNRCGTPFLFVAYNFPQKLLFWKRRRWFSPEKAVKPDEPIKRCLKAKNRVLWRKQKKSRHRAAIPSFFFICEEVLVLEKRKKRHRSPSSHQANFCSRIDTRTLFPTFPTLQALLHLLLHYILNFWAPNSATWSRLIFSNGKEYDRIV